MKKIWMSLLALTLVLSLIGCGSQTAQNEANSPAAEKPAENTAQEEANGAEDKPQTGTIAWHYVLTTDKRTEEKKNAEGVLLAETRYELPKLEAICDGGDTSLTPPEAQRKVCEVFNSRVAELSKSLTTVEKLAESAQEQYTEMSEEYRKSFGSYTEELRVSESRQRGDLLEVSFQTYGYWGGAHGGSSFFSWHYDLADGKFIELADLSDQPGKLNQMVANEIISSIENGINKPAIDTLLLISDALGCTVSELIGQSQKAAALHPLDAQLLSIFHQLNDTGKSLLISQAESILQQSALRKEASILFNQRSV